MSVARPTRREWITAACAGMAATALPELAARQIGPPPHTKGPIVFLDYDQVELDAAYNQDAYVPNAPQIRERFASDSDETRARIGRPDRAAYGPSDIEKLDIYRVKRKGAPIHVHIHGGAWRRGSAAASGYLAENFLTAGAHFVAPDFVWVQDAGGDLTAMADQVRRSIAWVYNNAAFFGGDPKKIYLSGHSSGAHLAAVALVTNWERDFSVPNDIIKGAMCISGMYDLKAVRLSSRNSYVKFDDEMEQALSPQRHIDKLNVPILVAYGTCETPEFQRQNREFAAAVQRAGKPVELLVRTNYNHFETDESLGNPFGVLGRAALKQMNLAPVLKS